MTAGKYIYERGDGRVKHCWNKPEAGFVPDRGVAVGKCSSKITQEVAQKLLEDGIPEFYQGVEGLPVDPSRTYPNKIYNVFEGVPYEAAVTTPGISYHGYPWRGQMPRRILRELQKRAEQQGYAAEFKKWLRQYGDVRL